jgi:hypothetical protein
MTATPAPLAGPALALLTLACAATPDPVVPLALDSDAFAGTTLTGPSVERGADDLDLDGSWILSSSLSWHEELPAGERPLAGRLVVREGDADLFVTRAELAAGIQEGLAAGWRPAGGPLWEERRDAALPAGGTSVLEARYLRPAEEDDGLFRGPAWERARLEVSRPLEPGEPLVAALVLEGEIVPLARPDLLAEEAPPAPAAPVHVRERLVLERPPVVDGRRLALVLAVPTPEHPSGGIVVELTARRPEGAPPSELVEAARESIAESGALARDRARRFQEQLLLRSESMAEAIGRGRLPRSAVITIAQTSDARTAEEIGLVATEEDLADFVRHAAERRGGEPARTPEELGWIIERRALSWLLARRADEEHPMAPELAAVLIRTGGALAASPDLFLEVLGRSTSLEDLWSRIEAENLAALEDARPAPRVRAHDWLHAQGLAPEGFDPLDGREARRAALERHAERAAAGEEAP